MENLKVRGGGVDFDGCLRALASLVSTIQNTGGLVMFPDGNYAPEADHDWIDLGWAALEARNMLIKAGWDDEARLKITKERT